MDRKREYLEVKDKCVATQHRVDQLATIIEEEKQKVEAFVSLIHYKLSLGSSDRRYGIVATGSIRGHLTIQAIYYRGQ